MRFIKFVYQKDLAGVDEIDLSQQNLFNNLKGRFLETVVQVTMMKFCRETIDGKLFGKTGEIILPLFRFVDTKYAKGSKTRAFQIDVYGRELVKEKGKERVWVCECKYTKTKMGMEKVKKLEYAAEALKQEAAESGLTVPGVQMWLVSSGGFTGEVLQYVKDREDIYHSDHDGINGIFRAFGGNYNIPVFKK